MCIRDRDYDAWADGYEQAVRCKANRYDPDISVRSERVGNWIISAKVIGGCQGVICIYHAGTLMEHYKTPTIGLSCNEDAPADIKEFYQRAFAREMCIRDRFYVLFTRS